VCFRRPSQDHVHRSVKVRTWPFHRGRDATHFGSSSSYPRWGACLFVFLICDRQIELPGVEQTPRMHDARCRSCMRYHQSKCDARKRISQEAKGTTHIKCLNSVGDWFMLMCATAPGQPARGADANSLGGAPGRMGRNGAGCLTSQDCRLEVEAISSNLVRRRGIIMAHRGRRAGRSTRPRKRPRKWPRKRARKRPGKRPGRPGKRPGPASKIPAREAARPAREAAWEAAMAGKYEHREGRRDTLSLNLLSKGRRSTAVPRGLTNSASESGSSAPPAERG
jgi:hypothetical protein